MRDDIACIFEEFYMLEYGVHIYKPDILVSLGQIQHNTNHPYDGYQLHVSRRALKHIIERRKQDLLKRHTNEETNDLIQFLLGKMTEVVHSFDEYLYEKPDNHFFIKDFAQQNRPKIRVLTKIAGKQLHIKSIHIVKRTKKHHKRGDL